MGQDGWVYILDPKIIEKHDYEPYNDFNHCHLQEFEGKWFLTVYYDDFHDLYQEDKPDHTIKDYKNIGAVIKKWMVWN